LPDSGWKKVTADVVFEKRKMFSVIAKGLALVVASKGKEVTNG
jgi:hypothetical protein